MIGVGEENQYTAGMPETMFVLGREPALSAAELEARSANWGAEVLDVTTEILLVRHAQPLPAGVLDWLGGSIKQISVETYLPPEDTLPAQVEAYCTPDWLLKKFPAGRVEYGASIYGASGSQRQAIQRHFLSLKKSIRAEERPVRYVSSREPQLSAVTVVRNGLLKSGHEFVIAQSSRFLVIGTTVAVQDYQKYGLRDFGRPAADPKSGMLPPKLAQIMLNLAQVKPGDLLLDPFCGSGTVLQEAALIGVQEIHGSDDQPRAVKASQENIRWLFKEFSGMKVDIEITKRDVRSVNIRPTVIVTEPDLGKPLHGRESQVDLKRELSKVEQLYRGAFRHWRTILRPGGRVVMVWPMYVHRQGNLAIDLENELRDLGFQSEPLVSELTATVLKVEDPKVLNYGRPDAHLVRQIRKFVLV